MNSYIQSDLDSGIIEANQEFESCEFTGIDFSKSNMKSITFVDCKFTQCNFANQDLTNVSLRGTSFYSCNLIGINWCSLKRFEPTVFQDSKLNFSVFQNLKLKRIQLINCSAIEVDFAGCDLSFADFSNTIFAGANFDRANLSNADFRLSKDYIFDIRTAKIKGAKFSFPYVISLITALGAEVDL